MKLRIRYIFDDDESRREGLRGKELSKFDCALFVYGDPVYPRFWMRGVDYDLNIAAIADSKVVWSELMLADTDDVHASKKPSALMVESIVPLPVGASVDIEDNRLVVY